MARNPNNVIFGAAKETYAVLASIRCWAEIGASKKRFGVAQFESTFILDQIPRAVVTLGVGDLVARETDETGLSDLQKIQASSWSDFIKQYDPVTVYAEITGAYDENGTEWPDGPFVIFKGYVAGMGFGQAWNMASVRLDVVHWLIDLDATSGMSDRYTPTAASRLIMPFRPLLEGEGGLSVFFVVPSDGVMVGVFEDVWLKCLKPVLRAVCNSGTVTQTGLGGALGTTQLEMEQRTSNQKAAARLKEPPPADDDDGIFDNPKRITVGHLKLATGGAQYIHSSLQAEILKEINKMMHTTTVWTHLRKLADVLGFHIVANVSSATCVPFIAQLKDKYYKEVKANEYTDIQLSAALNKPLRGLLMPGILVDQSGITGSPTPNKFYSFFNPNMKEGLIDYREAPEWLHHGYMSLAVNTRAIAGSGLPKIQCMENKGGGGGLLGAALNAVRGFLAYIDRTAAANALKFYGDKYCEAVYWTMQFAGREGTIDGKLRWDIAPGSIIKVQLPDRPQEGRAAGAKDLYAAVTGVKIVLDAQSRRGSTTFMLQNIRTEAEKSHGTDSNPLYENGAWLGTWLQWLQGVNGATAGAPPPDTDDDMGMLPQDNNANPNSS